MFMSSSLSIDNTDEAPRKNVTARMEYENRRKTFALSEYSQVFEMEDTGNLDSMVKDSNSGISSTSNSTNSYSRTYQHFRKAPWYQAEIQR